MCPPALRIRELSSRESHWTISQAVSQSQSNRNSVCEDLPVWVPESEGRLQSLFVFLHESRNWTMKVMTHANFLIIRKTCENKKFWREPLSMFDWILFVVLLSGILPTHYYCVLFWKVPGAFCGKTSTDARQKLRYFPFERQVSLLPFTRLLSESAYPVRQSGNFPTFRQLGQRNCGSKKTIFILMINCGKLCSRRSSDTKAFRKRILLSAEKTSRQSGDRFVWWISMMHFVLMN